MSKYFEWDDTEAAHRYRLVQARNLVNHIVLGDQQYRDYVCQQALKEVQIWQQKYAQYSDILGPIFDAIADVSQ